MFSNSTSILTKSGYGLGGGNGFGLDSSFSPSIQHNSYNSSTTATNTIGNFKGVMLCNSPFDGMIGMKDNRSSILHWRLLCIKMSFFGSSPFRTVIYVEI